MNLLIDRSWQKRIKRDNIQKFIIDHPEMNVRLVKGHYEYDEQYIKEDGKKVCKHLSSDSEYFTNLSMDEFDRDDLIHIYHTDR